MTIPPVEIKVTLDAGQFTGALNALATLVKNKISAAFQDAVAGASVTDFSAIIKNLEKALDGLEVRTKKLSTTTEVAQTKQRTFEAALSKTFLSALKANTETQKFAVSMGQLASASGLGAAGIQRLVASSGAFSTAQVKAASDVARLTKEVQELASKVEKGEAEFGELEAATKKLSTAQKELERAFDQTDKALQKLTADEAKALQVLGQLAQIQQRFNDVQARSFAQALGGATAQQRFTQEIVRQAAAAGINQAALQKLAASTGAFSAQELALANNVAKLKAELDVLTNEFKETAGAEDLLIAKSRQLVNAQTKLKASQDATAASLKKQKTAVTGIEKVFGGFQLTLARFNNIMAALRNIVTVVDQTLGELFRTAREGAVILQTAKSFEIFANNIAGIPDLLQQLQKESKGTVSAFDLQKETLTLVSGLTDELASTFTRALIGAGEFETSLVDVARAAQILNPALGDVDFFLKSLSIGIKRNERRWIDNLGIVISARDAYSRFAEANNKSVLALTAEDKQLATLNETLRVGQLLVDQVGDSVDSAVDPFKRLETQVADLTNRFKVALAEGLLPFIEVLSGDVTLNVEDVVNNAIGASEALREAREEAIALGEVPVGNPLTPLVDSAAELSTELNKSADDIRKVLFGKTFQEKQESGDAFGTVTDLFGLLLPKDSGAAGAISEAVAKGLSDAGGEVGKLVAALAGASSSGLEFADTIKVVFAELDGIAERTDFAGQIIDELERASGSAGEFVTAFSVAFSGIDIDPDTFAVPVIESLIRFDADPQQISRFIQDITDNLDESLSVARGVAVDLGIDADQFDTGTQSEQFLALVDAISQVDVAALDAADGLTELEAAEIAAAQEAADATEKLRLLRIELDNISDKALPKQIKLTEEYGKALDDLAKSEAGEKLAASFAQQGVSLFRALGQSELAITDFRIALGDLTEEQATSVRQTIIMNREINDLFKILAESGTVDPVLAANAQLILQHGFTASAEQAIVLAGNTEFVNGALADAVRNFNDAGDAAEEDAEDLEHLNEVTEATAEATAKLREELGRIVEQGFDRAKSAILEYGEAQQGIIDSSGEFKTITINNSARIAAITDELFADLDDDTKKALEEQLVELRDAGLELSDEYGQILKQISTDISQQERDSLILELFELRIEQGSVVSGIFGKDDDAIKGFEEDSQAAIQELIDARRQTVVDLFVASGTGAGFEAEVALSLDFELITDVEAELLLANRIFFDTLDSLFGAGSVIQVGDTTIQLGTILFEELGTEGAADITRQLEQLVADGFAIEGQQVVELAIQMVLSGDIDISQLPDLLTGALGNIDQDTGVTGAIVLSLVPEFADMQAVEEARTELDRLTALGEPIPIELEANVEKFNQVEERIRAINKQVGVLEETEDDGGVEVLVTADTDEAQAILDSWIDDNSDRQVVVEVVADTENLPEGDGSVNTEGTMPTQNTIPSGNQGGIPEFQQGGFTGRGQRNKKAGTVEFEEFVFSAPDVDAIGLDKLNALKQGDALVVEPSSFFSGGLANMPTDTVASMLAAASSPVPSLAPGQTTTNVSNSTRTTTIDQSSIVNNIFFNNANTDVGIVPDFYG